MNSARNTMNRTKQQQMIQCTPAALMPIVSIKFTLRTRIRRLGKMKEEFIHYREKREMRWEECLVPFDSGYNYGPVRDTSHSSGFEEHHHYLLVVNEELSILMGDLRRKRGASERCCNELNVMLDARDGDNFLQRQEIDRLVGKNRDLRAHIGSLEFEITRLRKELEGGYY
ncbi:hypothetical protein Tco_1305955 [Tanacetum coccineum]